MARQASEDKPHFWSGFLEWYDEWLEERTRYSSWMIVQINEPPKEDDWVSIVVFPQMNRRDSLGCLADPRYRGKGYEIPRCVVHEPLSGKSAGRLHTILSLIKQLQGLDYRQGLAFIAQLLIMFVDYQRATQGNESILFGPTYKQFSWTTEGQKRLLQLTYRPIWSFEELFKFWDLLGGHLASGFDKSPDGSLGQPNYLTIPPTWLTVDQLKTIHSDDPKSLKIPMLVKPSYKPLAESLLNFYQTIEQAGVPLHVHFDAPKTANQAEGAVEQYVFRQDGDFWTIIYQGKRLPPMKSKSLRSIAFLLSHPRQAFGNAIEFVSAVEKQDASFIVKPHHKLAEELLNDGNLSRRFESDTGQIFDTKTKRAVERRRDELLEKLAAQNFENPEQAAEMRAEADQLKAHLSSTASLGGKLRKSGDPNEKARKSVSQAIHRGLKEIAQHHPALADHLRRTLTPIKYPLCYSPDPPIDWAT